MQVGKVGIKDLDTMIIPLSDEDFSVMINYHITWIIKLQWLRSLGSNKRYKGTLWCQYLQSVVASVSNNNIAIWKHCHPSRPLEL